MVKQCRTTKTKPQEYERYVGVKEVALYLDASEKTIYDWTSRGVIPHYKIGKRLKFRLSQINRWAEKRFQKEKRVEELLENIK